MLVISVSGSVRTDIVYKILCFLMRFIIPRNNRNISLKNAKKNLWILPIIKDGNISPDKKYRYEKIYIHNNVWKFCGDQYAKQMTLKYNPLEYSGTTIFKTVIFYVAIALFSNEQHWYFSQELFFWSYVITYYRYLIFREVIFYGPLFRKSVNTLFPYIIMYVNLSIMMFVTCRNISFPWVDEC